MVEVQKIKHIITAFFLTLLLFGVFLRFYDITLRPLHHDESVNYFFLETTREKGYYPYSHQNYHGPTHFYAITLSTYLFGSDKELPIKLPTIIASLLLLLPLSGFFRDRKSYSFIFASIFTILSPSLIFYARYSIHEISFALFSCWLALAVYRWKTENKAKWLYHGAVALALLVLTKETYIISGFCIFWGYLFIGSPLNDFKILRSQKKHLALALILFSLLCVTIVSGGFQWMAGVRELFLSVPQWIGRNSSDTGHHKPFLYYAVTLLKTEPWLLALPLVVLLSFLLPLSLKRQSLKSFFSDKSFALHRFSTAWATTSFLVYSILKYKMPWLILNMNIALIVSLTCWLSELKFTYIKPYIAILFLTLLTSYYSYLYNFKIPYGNENPFSYVHTSKGMMDLLGEIRTYWKKHPKAKVLFSTNQYWPVPYYVRDKKELVGYIKSKSPKTHMKEYKILVMDKTVNWEEPNWKKKYYRLADNQESNTYFYTGEE